MRKMAAKRAAMKVKTRKTKMMQKKLTQRANTHCSMVFSAVNRVPRN